MDERLLFLIDYLIKEDERYIDIAVPVDVQEQKKLLRSLLNLRLPKPVSEEFLSIQDAYLQDEIKKRGIVDANSLSPIEGNGKIYLWQGDITTLKVDAIVNAANSALLGCFVPCHGCIDNIIHTLSGVQLRAFCDDIMTKQGRAEITGDAKITPAFNLPSKYILHTVGPIINAPLSQNDIELLENCYKSCLNLAVDNNVKSIAFCCISTGEFHFPKHEAAKIAVQTVRDFLKENTTLEKVVFNVFSDEDRQIYKDLLSN